MHELPHWLAFAQQASFPVIALAALLGAAVAFIRVMPQLRQTQLEGDKSLRGDLLRRVTELESEVKALRKAMDAQRVAHASELLDMQHDLTNESASLDAFMLLAEHNPETVPDLIPKIQAMREEHRQRMAIKRGAREATLIGQEQAA